MPNQDEVKEPIPEKIDDPYGHVPRIHTLEELKAKVDELVETHGSETPVKLWVTFPNGNGIVPFHIAAGVELEDQATVFIGAFIDKSRVSSSDPSRDGVL